MSIEAVQASTQATNLAGTKKLVLLILSEMARIHPGYIDPVCWPSVSTVASLAGRSDRHISRILSELESDGWIKRYPNNTLASGRKDKRTTLYGVPLQGSNGVTLATGRKPNGVTLVSPRTIRSTRTMKNQKNYNQKNEKVEGLNVDTETHFSQNVFEPEEDGVTPMSPRSQRGNRSAAPVVWSKKLGTAGVQDILKNGNAKAAKAQIGQPSGNDGWRDDPRFEPVRKLPGFWIEQTEQEADYLLTNFIYRQEEKPQEQLDIATGKAP